MYYIARAPPLHLFVQRKRINGGSIEKEEIIAVLRNESASEKVQEIIELFEKEESHDHYLKRRNRIWEISFEQNNDQSYIIEITLTNRQIPT